MQKITSKKKLAVYGCSGLGVNMLNIIMGSYLCSALMTGGFETHIESWTYLNKTLVVAGLWAFLRFIAKAFDGLIDLPLATFADKLHSRFGRRKTAILIGLIPTVISYCLFLVPLNTEESYLNTIWFGALLIIFYACYTLTMLTYYATFSEICKDEGDALFLSNAKSICDVVYFSLSFALVPVFVTCGVNIRLVALIFLPLVLSMLIPFFMLKENGEGGEDTPTAEPLTLGRAVAVSVKNKAFIYWMITVSVMTIGLQLFLGGINELFSSTGLNMTVVMASSFAPVPITILAYNAIVKKHGLGLGYKFVLVIFAIGMGILLLCYAIADVVAPIVLTLIAVFGGIFISFSLGAFFSITYIVPTNLAQRELELNNNSVSPMFFAVQGVFEGVAAGIATGPILTLLKDKDVIYLLPIVVIVFCIIAFVMSFFFPDEIKYMSKNVSTSKNEE
ncbi:MAG: MFS transporter [Clostridia bacterium]|nr:MFS transporter [Clostridia bacterium]